MFDILLFGIIWNLQQLQLIYFALIKSIYVFLLVVISFQYCAVVMEVMGEESRRRRAHVPYATC